MQSPEALVHSPSELPDTSPWPSQELFQSVPRPLCYPGTPVEYHNLQSCAPESSTYNKILPSVKSPWCPDQWQACTHPVWSLSESPYTCSPLGRPGRCQKHRSLPRRGWTILSSWLPPAPRLGQRYQNTLQGPGEGEMETDRRALCLSHRTRFLSSGLINENWWRQAVTADSCCMRQLSQLGPSTGWGSASWVLNS